MKTPDSALKPTKIEGFSAGEMLLEWSNGETYAVPYAEVRYHCPCAFCVDEHTGQRKIQRQDVKPGIKPMQAQIVGQYAIKFWWTDRHDSGIYAFESLLGICHLAGRLLKADEKTATPEATPRS